jgi:hypothetical protein
VGCSFFGIAGHVYDLARTPIIGNLIRVTGPNNYQEDAIPGSQPIYGAGGFELVLSDQPTTTTNQYNVQLLNAAAEPLSDVIQLQTFCRVRKKPDVAGFCAGALVQFRVADRDALGC